MKHSYTSIIFFFVLQLSFGQIGFSNSVLFDAGNTIGDVHEVISVDIDNDGDQDVLVATHKNVGWFEKLESFNDYSNFNIIASIPVNSSQPTAINVKDLDGDGDNDIVFGSALENIIYWSENLNGLGDFGQKQIVSNEVDYLVNLTANDVDDDGDYDIVSVSRDDGKIAWYENLNGLGDFSNQQVIEIIAQPHSLVLFDVDMDGDKDIVTNSHFDYKIIWLENLGGFDSFAEEQIIDQLDMFNFRAESMSTTDVDGDGDLDLVVGYNTYTILSDQINWYENLDGFGDFGSRQLISSEIDVDDSVSILTLDFDNDGDNDIISASDNDGKIIWLENLDGLGTFSAEIVISNDFEGVKTFSLVDIDDDGNLDVIAGLNDENQKSEISLFYKSMGSSIYREFPICSAYGSIGEMYVIDVNNDGNDDILTNYSNLTSDKFIWLNNIEGNFESFSPRYISTGYEGNKILPSDVNNDGYIDVLARSIYDDKTFWSQNLFGFDFFSNVFDFNDGSLISNMSANDLDGDSFVDLVIGRNVGNEIVWYKSQSGITFSSPNLISSTSPQSNSSTYVHTSDIDGDGDYDILASIDLPFVEAKIVWYENTDGLGNFSQENTINYITGGNGVGDLYTSDIDNDGDLDVVTYWRFLDKIVWYENIDGNGNFGPELNVSDTADDIVNLSIGDLDNDGDLDITSISRNSGNVAWYRNQDGLGDFGDYQEIGINLGFGKSLITFDIDNNGSLDIISSIDNKIVVHKNLGINANQINGRVRIDVNSDACDITDIPISNVMIEATDGNNSMSTFTSDNGLYQLFTEEGSYTTSIVSPLPTYYSANPTTVNSEFVGLGNMDSIDFCLTPNQAVNDLSIIIYPPIDDPRPGFDTSYQLVYKNSGTTQLSGSVTFEFDDSKVQFLSASETLASQTSSTLTFNYVDLNPFETRTIDLEFNVFVPPITEIGDELISTATINPVSGDETEDDNMFVLEQTVIGSYDPNDITCLEGEQILIDDADKYLHYLIRFQNTGTASAFNVRVENVLDDKLDWTTMQLESLSHNARVEILNGSEVSFIFDNINLPDSTNNEPNSHGFIAYKIKPKDDVVVGDIFYNTAAIYFDFNPPIITNTYETEIVEEELSVSEFENKQFKIFPNPTNSKLTIQSKVGMNNISVIDINGRLLKTFENLELNQVVALNVESLSDGIYFLKIEAKNSEHVIRFIKNQP